MVKCCSFGSGEVEVICDDDFIYLIMLMTKEKYMRKIDIDNKNNQL